MIVLAIDTCLTACSVAVVEDDRVLAEASEPMARGHQERLAPLTRDVMDASGLDFASIDRVGVTIGPGSFTGLRVGLAFAKGLALALERPCVGVGTLEALAAGLASSGPRAAVIDAGRGRVFVQIFEGETAIVAPDSLEIETAVARLAELVQTGDPTLTGPGAGLLSSVAPRARVIDQPAPSPVVVARLAARAPVTPPRPLYLRAPDAKPKSRVIFEPTTIDDATTLAQLHASAFHDSWTASEITTLIRGAGTFGFVAREDAQITGFVLCRTIADEAEVLTLATAPAHRRGGVARGLVIAASSHAAVRGAVKLFLEVAEDNHAAIALYRDFGFQPVGARAGYYSRPGGAISALVMRRDLNR